MNKKISELVGWYGVAAILVAYSLNVFMIIAPTSQWFLWLNLTGSAGIVISSWRKRDFQPVILNMIWLAIAIVGLLQRLT